MGFLDAPERSAAGTMDEELAAMDGEAEVAARSPFNRRLRRKWEGSKEDWGGYEIVTIDIEEDAR